MVGLLLLLLLSAPVGIVSAQVPARVETPYTLIDAESRTRAASRLPCGAMAP